MFWRQVVASQQTSNRPRTFTERQAELFAEGYSFSGYERDYLGWNRGDGTFLDISGVSGADSIGDGRGSVFADFDNDGDLDVFLSAVHGPSRLLLRNNVGTNGNWVRIVLRGTSSGRDAFGTVVRVHTEDGGRTKLVSGGTGFLGQSDRRLVFGIGKRHEVERIEVSWPSGTVQRFGGASDGETLLLVEGAESAERLELPDGTLPDPLSAGDAAWGTLMVRPGQWLPNLELLRDGATVRLQEQLEDGKPALINFWATWCVPCRAEMPELEKLSQKGNATILGISLDAPKDRDQIAPVLEQLGVTYPTFTLDDAAQARLFRTVNVSVPLTLLLDKDHRVQHAFRGWSDAVRQRLDELLN